MRKDKIDNYRLTGSIHTLAIKSDGYIENPMDNVTECVTVSSRETEGRAQSTTIINPNLKTTLLKPSFLYALDNTEYIGTIKKAQIVSSIRSYHSI